MLLLNPTLPVTGSVKFNNNTAYLPRGIPTEVWRTKKKASDRHGSDKFMAGHMWTCGRFFSYLSSRVWFLQVLGLVARR